MLKVKLQNFGHLMQIADSLEKSLILGKTEDRRKRGHERMRWLDGITDTVDMNLGKLQEMVSNRETWHAAVRGVAKSQMWVGEQNQHKSKPSNKILRQWLSHACFSEIHRVLEICWPETSNWKCQMIFRKRQFLWRPFRSSISRSSEYQYMSSFFLNPVEQNSEPHIIRFNLCALILYFLSFLTVLKILIWK